MSQSRILAKLRRQTGIPTIYRFELERSQILQDQAPQVRAVLPIARDFRGEDMPLWSLGLVDLWPENVPDWVWSTVDKLDAKHH